MKLLKSLIILFVVLAITLLFIGCSSQKSDMKIIQGSISSMSDSYISSQNCEGTMKYDSIMKEDVCIPVGGEVSSSSYISSSSSSEPKLFKEVVLVDQGYTGIESVIGMDRLKFMNTKVLAGTLKEAYLTVELTRGDYADQFGTVAMYVLPYNDGVPQPSIETKRFEFIDAVWKGNCSRHISPKSNLTTIGMKVVEKQYDLSNFPVTAEDPCSTEPRYHNYIGAINTEFPDVDFAFGFMPSDSRDHLKVTLRYRGDLTISQF